ncbi:MAG: hypothetical protein Kow0068_21630 [Marinilabiliales bacterium]
MKISFFIGLLIAFLLSSTSIIFAQPKNSLQDNQNIENNSFPFEGSIKFVQITMSDTNYYTYHIKGNKVRLDVHENCNACDNIENSMLFDLEKKTVIALNPSRKLYMNVPTKPYIEKENNQYQIIKSRNSKKIHGYKCYQWRVKNVNEKTEIAYWVANDNFMFFEDFLKLWNRSEKHALYYLQIPDTKGYFPMLSVERTILRDQKMKLEVVNIEKKQLPDSLFEIPENYQSYNH